MALAASPTAGSQGPRPAPLPPALPQPVDRPFPGTVTLDVDATDTVHGIFSAHEELPVRRGGDVVLLYPEWETASHAPTALAKALAGLVVKVDGRRVEWRRDPVDTHAFHVAVPTGARRLQVDLQYIPERPYLRRDLVEVFWHRLLVYPAGWFTRNIPVKASVKLPDGLHAFTSLDADANSNAEGAVRYRTVDLETLADAPVMAGRHWRRFDLAPGATVPVMLDVVAEAEADLAVGEPQLARLRAMVGQTSLLLGPPPFRHYDAIAILTDALPDGGVEHLEEGENDLPSDFFRDPASHLDDRDLIAHELVHAWNGRSRQPADLWTPTWNQPARGSLLWVYEGQTEFWGRVLAARSGLRSMQDTLDKLALDAAFVSSRRGRAWKSLADSANDPIHMAMRPKQWTDWTRRQDYYAEGVLLWLDVDARLRELTGGRRGLDDFARRFFQAERAGVISTYTFADVCRGLELLAPGDWAGFLERHLQTHSDADAMAGLERSGWRLVFRTTPSTTFRQLEDGGSDLTYSVGLTVDDEGRVGDVAWDGPAFRAGVAPGMRLLSVNGQPFTLASLQRAVAATARTPLVAEVADEQGRRAIHFAYDGGPRYPSLERIPGRPDLLNALLSPR